MDIDTIDWAISSINSCLWNLEGNPKLEMHDREWIVKDLRENLNKKEIAVARLEELKNGDLKIEMRNQNIINSCHVMTCFSYPVTRFNLSS